MMLGVLRYEKNGILDMLRRNIGIKTRPERWQDDRRHFNLVVCFEQRIFDIVLEGIATFFLQYKYNRKPLLVDPQIFGVVLLMNIGCVMS